MEATTADHAVSDAVEFIRTTRHRRDDWIPEQTTTVRDGQQVTVSVEVDAFAGDGDREKPWEVRQRRRFAELGR